MADYPDFEQACGYGSVTGIGGANCRHSFWPFIEGVSERTYTDEELEGMKPENRPKTVFDGREYDDYQATQMQRRIERTIRKQKRRKAAYEAAGLTEDAQAANIRLRRLNEKYHQFSRAAGLPEQRERLKVLDSLPRVPVPLANAARPGIINAGAVSGALSPDSPQALAHAERYYQAVRAMTTDVEHISANTGYPIDVIQKVKDFIFMDVHDLGDGRFSRFDASFEMAQSWQRLIEGKNIQPHDLTLLRHEIMEKQLMDSGYTQDEAHTLTSQIYNYAKEAYKFHYG